MSGFSGRGSVGGVGASGRPSHGSDGRPSHGGLDSTNDGINNKSCINTNTSKNVNGGMASVCVFS